MTCACLRDEPLDCARARYGDTDEACDCICHYADDDADGLDEACVCDCAPSAVSHQNNPLSEILSEALKKNVS